jgi:oligopeptide/dipeptide ABC transporter ATP-binding protein
VTVNPARSNNETVDEPLMVLDHVVKEFPITHGVLQRRVGSVKAVSDVSFEIARGETFGLVGESGCGKTTLGRLITVLEKLDSGTIRFDGEEISKLRGDSLRRRRQDFQLMFQDPYASLDPRMRIQSILREPLVAQRIGSKQEQVARIRELLAEVGLGGDTMGLYPHEFSGGQRQRIGFARALTVEPRLIVADEPVSALDVSIQSQVLNLMKRLQTERDLTYIIISHDLSVVRYLADRIGVMYLGKLVEIGPASEVYENPAHPYTAGLLEAIPEPDPVTERARAKSKVAISGELPSAANPPSGCRFRTRCPRAQEVCAAEEPVLQAFNVAGHQAACHFPLQTPLNLDSRAAASLSG